MTQNVFASVIRGLQPDTGLSYYPADTFPLINPVHWLTSHFAVGGYSPLQRLSGMLTAHMTQIAPHNGFTWHPHRGLEIYTYVIDGELYHEDTTGGKGTITAGEVQRMFSGYYIEHQELNRTADFARVIQIWFVADTKYMGLPAHYQQVGLNDMTSTHQGDGLIREIIGENGATDSHVNARLTSTILPPGGQTTLIPPRPNEDLFVYIVNGDGHFQTDDQAQDLGLYDVLLATPSATMPTITTNHQPLNFLSFYLPSFI
ncbi:MAG TPA: pirin family protein [Anaerolineae bacterium]|nr:pirin family protein [Anaerolineae bacterium]